MDDTIVSISSIVVRYFCQELSITTCEDTVETYESNHSQVLVAPICLGPTRTDWEMTADSQCQTWSQTQGGHAISPHNLHRPHWIPLQL